MLTKGLQAFHEIAEIPNEAWFTIFRRAASLMQSEAYGEARGIVALASRITGLPIYRVKKALETLADHLLEIETLLQAQSPTGTFCAYERGSANCNWRWLPAGRTVAIRIPGNFPTININWLLALALRRPVLLCATLADPITPHFLVELLYRAGAPDGAMSLGFGEAELLYQGADQLLWSGDRPPKVTSKVAHQVQRYHQGRSKLLLLDHDMPASYWSRLAALIVQGCGRLCTNPSAILVECDAKSTARTLAEHLATYSVLPLDSRDARVPAFPDTQRADYIIRKVEEAKARGAVDVSYEVTGQPMRQICDGLIFLRPTVLVVDRRDPLFGAEFPFPFVTISEVSRPEMPRYSGGSLIVSVIGGDSEIVRALTMDPSIDKVFVGEHFDRGYWPTDPHQGFLVDFLFHKKAVLVPSVTEVR
jgi:thienamycin biosynthesis protein ThnO